MNQRIKSSGWFLVFLSLLTCCANSGEKKEKVLLENRNICVFLIGAKDSILMKDLPGYLEGAFHQKIKVAEKQINLDFAYHAQRKQHNSSAILETLRTIKEKECEHLLAIVDVDLYVPDLNFVFGEADFQTKSAVISTARLRQEFYGLPENRQFFLERVVKEAVHELGHTYGLSHCANRKCVMHFSNSLYDTDLKSYSFCKKCNESLKLVTKNRCN